MKTVTRLRKRIAVTGGAGFIGSHLCDRLIAEGHFVLCIDNFRTGRSRNLQSVAAHRRFSLMEADVTRLAGRRLGEIDEVYHLACPASPPHYQADPIHTMMTCVVGTGAALAYAAENGARVLLASTSEVYGDPEQHPQVEDYRGAVSCIGPRACYDEGKRAAEALVYDYVRTHGVQVRVARIFNTYGPRMRDDDGRVVPNFIRQALAGDPLTIYGRGDQTRSFCYVADLVEGLIRLMERPEEVLRPVNLGNPRERTVRSLAETISRLCNVSLRFTDCDLPEDDPRRRCPDIARARELLDWAPSTRLEEGLGATIAAFRLERASSQPLLKGAPSGVAAQM